MIGTSAGNHYQQVHEHLVENSQHDLEQVQADEIKAKTQFGTLWMAFAIWVPTRLWMGGVARAKRDLELIQSLADKVRQMALCRPLLLAVDGLASYVSAFRSAFRSQFPRQAGETGRCKMISWSDIYIVQVVKQRAEGILNVERRIVQGTKDMVAHLIKKTQGQGVINTAFIERLNAAFRQRISPLTRRTRNLVQLSQQWAAWPRLSAVLPPENPLQNKGVFKKLTPPPSAYTFWVKLDMMGDNLTGKEQIWKFLESQPPPGRKWMKTGDSACLQM